MLSASTIHTLDELARRSHAEYTEGGLLYTFTEAANQAHCNFPAALTGRGGSSLAENDRMQLAIVICKTLGNFSCTSPDAESLMLADSLMECLRTDLGFSMAGLAVDDDDDFSWGSTVHMAREKDNRYFSLTLWGSID